MSAESPRTVKSKKPSKFSTPATPATPAIPATPSAQMKRGLTSPDVPIDQKKNKPCLSPMSHTGEVVPMEGATGGPLSDSDDSHSKYNITLREADIAQISMALKESFRDELRVEMATLVKGIVDGVLIGVNEKTQSMEKEVKSLKKENASLKFRVQKLESAAEVAEQYSRRNCLRVSGIGETVRENTDEIILKMLKL